MFVRLADEFRACRAPDSLFGYRMLDIAVEFAGTTGTTEAVAHKIADALGARALNVSTADTSAFDAELLVLGSSTWGVGDLQDDWAAKLDEVKSTFAGNKVAVPGLGDSQGFEDSFCVAAETIANAAKDAGEAHCALPLPSAVLRNFSGFYRRLLCSIANCCLAQFHVCKGFYGSSAVLEILFVRCKTISMGKHTTRAPSGALLLFRVASIKRNKLEIVGNSTVVQTTSKSPATININQFISKTHASLRR